MSARVNIEAEAWADLRYETLARLLKLADGHHALIRCARIWAWQTEHFTEDEPTYVVDRDTIDSALGVDGGADAMVRARLAEEVPEGFRIKGGKGRIEWLHRNRANGERSRATASAKRKVDDKHQAPARAPAPAAPGPLTPALVLPDTHTGSESVGPEPSAIGGGDQALVTRGALPDAWSPADTQENRAAATGAVGRGVGLAYALAKFHELSRARGTLALDWDAAWRLFLLAERPTPAFAIAPSRTKSAATDRAARDRERSEADERKQRAEADREEVRRAARAVVASLGGSPNVEKTTK